MRRPEKTLAIILEEQQDGICGICGTAINMQSDMYQAVRVPEVEWFPDVVVAHAACVSFVRKLSPQDIRNLGSMESIKARRKARVGQTGTEIRHPDEKTCSCCWIDLVTRDIASPRNRCNPPTDGALFKAWKAVCADCQLISHG